MLKGRNISLSEISVLIFFLGIQNDAFQFILSNPKNKLPEFCYVCVTKYNTIFETNT